MRVAALDLGSNTFLLLVAEVNDNRITKVLSDNLRVVRLAQGVHKNKTLSAEALKRAEHCFIEYQEIIQNHKVNKIVAVATSAARDAENAEAFFQLTEKYNIPVKIITGAEEAELTFYGSTQHLSNTNGVAVIDVGGGSTELIGRIHGQLKGKSLNIGSVRLTELLANPGVVSVSEIAELGKYINAELETQKPFLPTPVNQVIASAGTPTTLACIDQKIDFDEDRVDGYKIETDKILQWAQLLAALSLEERQKIKGMDPKRADVIVAGLLILYYCSRCLEVNEITVSTKGVRYGLAAIAESF